MVEARLGEEGVPMFDTGAARVVTVIMEGLSGDVGHCASHCEFHQPANCLKAEPRKYLSFLVPREQSVRSKNIINLQQAEHESQQSR